MAAAYSGFASGGYYTAPYSVTKIEFRETGEVKEFKPTKTRVMKDSTAYIMNNILESAVTGGFPGGARVYGSHVAAKTGTSNSDEATIKKYNLPGNAVNDLWTVAYTPEYSVALWYGYEKVDSSHYLSGASAPKDAVMRSIMKYIPKTTKTWSAPSSVVEITVEKETWPAKLPSEYTPDNMKTTEYFKKGTQPTEVSERYAKLEDVTNLNNTITSDGYKLTWNWKVPNVLDSKYLNDYFNNSVFGNQSAKYLSERISYNSNTLGGIGFGIYQKKANGTLERIAFTEDTEYIYKPDVIGNIELVVKAEYKNFKNNASNGTEITVKSSNIINSKEKLNVTLNGDSSLSVTKGNYVEEGITITYDDENITNKTGVIKLYKLNNKTYLSISDLEDAVNKLDNGTYKITYSVTYLTKTESILRTIEIQ